MPDKDETIRRLRAALAGVVSETRVLLGDGGSMTILSVETMQDIPLGSTFQFSVSRRIMLAALEVLRETAGEGKT